MKPQEARGVLPIDIKTEIVITCNYEEWAHIFSLRTNKASHPSMRQLMIPLYNQVAELNPVLFTEVQGN